MNSSLNAFSHSPTHHHAESGGLLPAPDSDAVLVREAGIPFQPSAANTDPFTEWLSLMEVVQMLCPAWPMRGKPTLGINWRL